MQLEIFTGLSILFCRKWVHIGCARFLCFEFTASVVVFGQTQTQLETKTLTQTQSFSERHTTLTQTQIHRHRHSPSQTDRYIHTESHRHSYGQRLVVDMEYHVRQTYNRVRMQCIIHKAGAECGCVYVKNFKYTGPMTS